MLKIGVPWSTFLPQLLAHIGKTSPECVPKHVHSLNSPNPLSNFLAGEKEEDAVTTVLDQRTMVLDYSMHVEDDAASKSFPAVPEASSSSSSSHESAGGDAGASSEAETSSSSVCQFQLPCLLASQLGWTSWHRRPHVQLLKKSERLLLEMKHLDQQVRSSQRFYDLIGIFFFADWWLWQVFVNECLPTGGANKTWLVVQFFLQ